MKRLVKVLGALAPLFMAQAAHAESVPKAMVLNLERDDLTQLAHGLEDVFSRTPVQARYDEPMQQDFWWGTITAQGIPYQFRLTNVRVTPAEGHVRVDVDVADLSASIDTVSWGSWYCKDIPLSTMGATVPVGTDINPWINNDDRSFHVATNNTYVGLDEGNFEVGRPSECHTLWGFNWLVRRIVPWTSGLLRSRVQEGIEQAIAQQAEKISSDYGQMLEVNVTLPVDAAPIPAFYATLGIWPDSFELTADHLKFYIGADVDFDPDPRFGRPEQEMEALNLPDLLKASENLPSYLGVARRLMEVTLQQANDKGLLRFDLGRDDAPDAAELLSAGVVALMIPDAAARFAPDAPVVLNFGGAGSVNVSVEPQGGPGGIPIIDFCLHDLVLGISVDGAPYYSLTVDADVSVALGLDPQTRKLKLTFQKLSAKVKTGTFAPGLSPEPTDLSFNGEFFDFFVKQLNDRMTADNQDLMDVILPQFRLGLHEIEFLGAGVRDDFVTLDAKVK